MLVWNKIGCKRIWVGKVQGIKGIRSVALTEISPADAYNCICLNPSRRIRHPPSGTLDQGIEERISE